MTSRRSILLGLVFGAFLGIFGLNSVYAQVPRSISYQGLLVKNNLPVTGLVNIDIAIYDAAGVTPLYTETESQVQVTNGIFNITLGGVAGILPASLKFDEQYFLGVNVEGTGEITPRTPFVAAPYAINAQTVGGIGVSVTPQPGMLLPLDINGKVPKAALPQAATSISTIDLLPGDATGNIRLLQGNGIVITDQGPGQITIAASSSTSMDTIVTTSGLTGGAIGTHWTLGIAQNGNWITNNMIGTGVVTGMKLDQNVPANGLYQDALGDLNVGTDGTLIYDQPTNPFAPVKLNGAVGFNLAHTNNWTVVQNFLGGITGAFGTLGTLGVNGTYLTVNGLAEPLAGPNAATYEVVDNGDMKVTGSLYTVGNTYIGAANSSTNTMGNPAQSANTITGLTNAMTGTTSNTITAPTNTVTGSTSNNVQSPVNNIGTTQAAGGVNNTGTAGVSTNNTLGLVNNSQAQTVTTGTNQTAGGTMTYGNLANSTVNINGLTNTITATTSNSVQSPINNIGTSQLVGNTNTIGTAGNSLNTITGSTNTTTGTVANNSQAPTVNIGTTQVAGGIINHGTAGVTTNNINGLLNNVQSQTNNIGTTQAGGGINNIGTVGFTTNNITGLTNNVTGTTNNLNATTNNLGTAPAGSTNVIGNLTSTNTVNGTTTFNGNVTHNGNITQTSGVTSLLGTTITGPLTQSGGNAAINGGAANVFGSVAGSSNAIGGVGSINSMTGLTNTFTASSVAPNGNNFAGNINQTIGSTTLLNTQVNGTLGSTGNITLGTTSTNNNIGAAGGINTFTGATNNITSTTATNFTGNIIQISGSAAFAPTGSTTNSFGTGASQTNNISTGNGTTTTIGNGSGNVNNIGTSVAGISTNNIGNLNVGTTNNIKGLTTFQYSTTGNTVLITGGPTTCAGAFPTSATSQLYADGDAYFAGTVAACRLNIFGLGGSCITNLNTTNFGSCGGPGVAINLINSIIGVPSGVGATDLTNMRNIQASIDIQTNVTLTIGVPGTNATNITSSNAGPASIAQQTPSVAGRIPTFQQYQLALVPATGPNGGGSVTFNAGNTGGLLNFDALSGISVAYRTHNVGFPVGELWITQTLTSVTVESSAAGDNNTVQIVILRP